MNRTSTAFVFLLCFFTLISMPSFGQVTIEGTVLDAQEGETVIGAQIRIKNFPEGTITDFDGQFSLTSAATYPCTLLVSSAGFESVEIVLWAAPQDLIEVILTPVIDLLNEVVISASRVEESLLASPSGVEKINLVEWQSMPGADAYTGLSFAKGIQLNAGSYLFPSINTRGFADAQNWRFLQFADGMELTSPGLGYSIGNVAGPNELDFRSIEIIPGPGSALYGPNAFNGLMAITSKDPFLYPGLSAQVKGGVTSQQATGSNPFLDASIRYAHVVSDKLAFKFNASYLTLTDWGVDDMSYHITATKAPFAAQFLSIPASSPNFDAVSRFGDEVQVPVLAGVDSIITVNRTGIAERDILDYGTTAVKLGGTVYYRPSKDVEATYQVNFFEGDAIIRHTTVYPLRNIQQFVQKAEIKGRDYYLRAYHNQEDANNSYALLGTGAFIQEGLKSSANWSQDYGAALRGEVPGIAVGDHAGARLFADRDIPGSDSELFKTLRQATLTNSNVLAGGSKFIEKSGFVHVEGMYDFLEKIPYFELQEGVSYRRYFLNSEGALFNDGLLGFNGTIPVEEYGAFTQASKTWLDGRVVMRASFRFDKNQNFEGRISPKIGVVFSPDKEKRHFIRLSAQSGFRNPSPQESYIALDIGDAVILGGTEDNITHYQYRVNNDLILNGSDIHEKLVSVPSVQAFLAGGGTNPALLQPLGLSFLRQEQIQTAELGYRGVIEKNLFVEVTGFYNEYKDFVTRTLGYSLEAGRVFAVYTNVETPITSYGAEVLLEYRTDDGYRIKGTYTYNQVDTDKAIEENPGFLPGFNSPPHRATLWVSNDNVYQGFGFSAGLRWSDAYVWQSPFGQGNINPYTVVDAYLSYRMPEINSIFKAGASNLFNAAYQTMYGGPEIGAQYYFSITFDEIFR